MSMLFLELMASSKESWRRCDHKLSTSPIQNLRLIHFSQYMLWSLNILKLPSFTWCRGVVLWHSRLKFLDPVLKLLAYTWIQVNALNILNSSNFTWCHGTVLWLIRLQINSSTMKILIWLFLYHKPQFAIMMAFYAPFPEPLYFHFLWYWF